MRIGIDIDNDIYADFFNRLMQVGKENKEDELVE